MVSATGTATPAVLNTDDGLAGTGGVHALDSDDITAGVIISTYCIHSGIENIATLRATNGGQVKRLQYAQADVDSKIANMTAAHGRIMDVDIAAESSNLAKQQILVQASAAMTAQANSANDVALLLLQ